MNRLIVAPARRSSAMPHDAVGPRSRPNPLHCVRWHPPARPSQAPRTKASGSIRPRLDRETGALLPPQTLSPSQPMVHASWRCGAA